MCLSPSYIPDLFFVVYFGREISIEGIEPINGQEIYYHIDNNNKKFTKRASGVLNYDPDTFDNYLLKLNTTIYKK